MKIAVSSYSFFQYLMSGKMTQLDVPKRAAELGFAGVEFTELSPVENPSLQQQKDYAKLIREKAADCGIEIVAYLVSANLYQASPEKSAAEVDRVCRQLDVAAILGAKIFRHDVCFSVKQDGAVVSFDKMLPTIAENARKITEYAEKLGIRTCSENHGYVAQDSDRVERLYNAVGHHNYGLLVDFGNFACADECSVTAVSRVAPYAVHCHAKDFQITEFGEKPSSARSFPSRGCRTLCGCAIGDGDIPVAQCVAIMKRAEYDGWISIEYEGSDDCIMGIQRGLANLKKYIEQ